METSRGKHSLPVEETENYRRVEKRKKKEKKEEEERREQAARRLLYGVITTSSLRNSKFPKGNTRWLDLFRVVSTDARSRHERARRAERLEAESRKWI